MISSIISTNSILSSSGGAPHLDRNHISCVPLEVFGEIFSFSNLEDLHAIKGVCKKWKEVTDRIKNKLEMGKVVENLKRSQRDFISTMTSFISMTALESAKLSSTIGDPHAVIFGNQIACVVPYKCAENGILLLVKVARYYKKTMLGSVNCFAHVDNNSLNEVGIRFNSKNRLQIVLGNKIVNYKIMNRGVFSPNELKLVLQSSTVKKHRSDSALNHSRLVTHYDRKRLYMTHDPVGTTFDSIKVVEDNGVEYDLPVPNSTSEVFSVRMASLNNQLLVAYNSEDKIKLCLYDLKTRSLVHERDFQDIGEDERNDIKYLIPDHFFYLGNDSLYIRTVNGLTQGFHRIDPNSLKIRDSFDATLEQGDQCINFKVIDNVCILVIRNNETLFLHTLDLVGKRNCRLAFKDNSTFYDASIIHSNYLAIKILQKNGLFLDTAFFCPQSMKILFQTEFGENNFVSLLENSSLGVKDGGNILYRGLRNARPEFFLSNQTINKLRSNSKTESLKGKIIRLSVDLMPIARDIASVAAFTLSVYAFIIAGLLAYIAFEVGKHGGSVPLGFHACVISLGLFGVFSAYIGVKLG